MSGLDGGDEQDVLASQPTILTFDIVASVACVSLVATLAPALFCSGVKRSKPWLNMIFTLMVLPLFYLLNAGHQFNSSSPPLGLCLFQAGLIHAGPPTCGAAVLAFIADVAFGLESTLLQKRRSSKSARFLLLLPAAVFSVVFVISILLVADPRSVRFDSSHTFCECGNFQVKFSASIVLAALGLSLFLEAWIFSMLYRNSNTVRSIRRTDLPLSVLCRLSVFTVVVGAGAILGAVVLPGNETTGGTWNLCLVAVPLLASLLFGTQRDVLNHITGMFRRSTRPGGIGAMELDARGHSAVV